MSDVLPEADETRPAVGPLPEAGSGASSARLPVAGGDGVGVASADGLEPAASTGEPPSSPATEQPGRPGGKRRRRRWLVSWLTVIVVGAAVALGLRLFVVQTFFVPSGSMMPTLQVGDRMLVLKLGYSLQRGAIVVFRQPPGDVSDTSGDDLVKRVIGLPGETIWSVGNTIYVNGRPLAQPWLPKNDPLGPPITRQKIPKGDNRSDSFDSRDWGPLPRSYIIGRVFLVIWRHGGPAFHVL